MAQGGPGACFSENLRTVVATSVLFEQFLGKLFAPKFEYFTKYDAIFSYIFDYACLRRKAYCYQ